MAHKILTDVDLRGYIDLNKNQIKQAAIERLASAPSSPAESQVYYNTGDKLTYQWNGTAWVVLTNASATNDYSQITDGTTTASAGSPGDVFKIRSGSAALTAVVQSNDATHGDNVLLTIAPASIDHGALGGLADDDHSQYVHNTIARTVSANHSFTNGTAPFSITSTNVVTNLNADLHDGAHATATPTASTIPIATVGGKLAAGWMSEVLALADLTDVTGLTGSGSTVVMSSSPAIVTPTIVSFVNATHNHLAAAGGGTITAAAVSDFNAAVRTNRLDQMATPTASVPWGSQKITGLADPTSAQDAATKAYVDATAIGLDVKPSARAASDVNVNTASPGATIGGVTMVSGDRALLMVQTSGPENGLWQWNGTATPMTRTTDADSSAEVTSGMFVFVEEGTSADAGFVLSTNNPIVLGTTSLSFTQFSGAGSITAGAGLTKTGNTLDVIGTANRILVVADAVDIASTYVGQSSITTLGTITTGIWTGTDIAVADGGTGASTAAAARTNLSSTALPLPQKYVVQIGNASLTAIVITHNLNTRALCVMCVESATPWAVVTPQIEMTSVNTITLTFNTAPTTNQYEVTVIG